MTTYVNESVVCGACGQVFTHRALGSTNTWGAPDLDLRPPEMERSTMDAWVQRCPSCGYCAREAAHFDRGVRPVIESAPYRSQLADASYPELASTFICEGMLGEASKALDEAGWSYLHAAWVLDDAGDDARARLWRSKAADMFTAALATGHPFAEPPGSAELLIIDALRRARRAADALAMIARAPRRPYDPIIVEVLRFQRALVESGDTGRHTLDEVRGGDTGE